MGKRDKLTVEVFRDIATPSVSVDPVLLGLQALARHVELDVIDESNLAWIDAGLEHPKHIDSSKIFATHARADLNIVISERKIKRERWFADILGRAYIDRHSPSPIGNRLALVAAHSSESVIASTVSHETAHLLNAKYEGDKTDRNGHCIDKKCVMHASIKPDISGTFANNIGTVKKIVTLDRETPRLSGFMYKNHPFCTECAGQIEATSNDLIEAKNGLSVPRFRIFPLRLLKY